MSDINRILPQPFFSGTSNEATLLEATGAQHINDLFSSIPAEIQQKATINLPDGLDEWEVFQELSEFAGRNNIVAPANLWAGSGAYQYPSPTVIDETIRRAELLTSYTPYQPEISQGSLQILFEFQTIVAHLMGLPIANGSIYDGPTALAEAIRMALRIKRKAKRVLISSALSTYCQEVAKTYLAELDVEIVSMPVAQDTATVDLSLLEKDDIVVLGYPNALGWFEDLQTARNKASDGLIISYTPDPHALLLMREPGSFGVDIAVGEGQPFGIALSYGGPYLGLFSCRQKYLRQMPGRVAGRTTDRDDKPGFVLTLSTREQHIRREKATSNICSNQGLLTVAFTAYAATLGSHGLTRMASRVFEHRQRMEQGLLRLGLLAAPLPGLHYNEFVVDDPRIEDISHKLAAANIQLGLAGDKVCPILSPQTRVLCAPAMAKAQDIDRILDAIEKLL